MLFRYGLKGYCFISFKYMDNNFSLLGLFFFVILAIQLKQHLEIIINMDSQYIILKCCNISDV
jgi:hypothetical protein